MSVLALDGLLRKTLVHDERLVGRDVEPAKVRADFPRLGL
jgi:hypothetical protein